MIVHRDDLIDMHRRIKECAIASPDAITVIILVALDTDAVAACAMLTKLLEQDEVSHKVKPVRDYGVLGDIFLNDIAEDAELRNIVLLNCGSIIDLNAHMQEKLDEKDGESEARNVEEVPHAECRWCLLDDGEPHAERDELVAQRHVLDDPEFAEEDEDEDEDERPAQRQRMSSEEYADLSPDSRASQFHALRRLMRRYYMASWFGPASSVLMWRVVSDLNRASNAMLWLAAVGLTDQLVHERVEYEKYVGEAQQLQAEVASLNQVGDLESKELHDASSNVTVVVAQHIHAAMRLESVQELRLSLLRHWSLLDAMNYSPYVATRLGLWSQKGRDNLHASRVDAR